MREKVPCRVLNSGKFVWVIFRGNLVCQFVRGLAMFAQAREIALFATAVINWLLQAGKGFVRLIALCIRIVWVAIITVALIARLGFRFRMGFANRCLIVK